MKSESEQLGLLFTFSYGDNGVTVFGESVALPPKADRTFQFFESQVA